MGSEKHQNGANASALPLGQDDLKMRHPKSMERGVFHMSFVDTHNYFTKPPIQHSKHMTLTKPLSLQW